MFRYILVSEKAPTRTRIVGIFRFYQLFLKTLIKNIIYCQTACLWTVYLYTAITWLKYMSNICCYCYWQQYFVQINVKGKVNENCSFNNSVSLSLVEGNTLAHKLRVIKAVKLQLNAIYAQHLALKLVHEKRQYIMGGKLFSSKKMFEP